MSECVTNGAAFIYWLVLRHNAEFFHAGIVDEG